jgi:hypothetical protein
VASAARITVVAMAIKAALGSAASDMP